MPRALCSIEPRDRLEILQRLGNVRMRPPLRPAAEYHRAFEAISPAFQASRRGAVHTYPIVKTGRPRPGVESVRLRSVAATRVSTGGCSGPHAGLGQRGKRPADRPPPRDGIRGSCHATARRPDFAGFGDSSFTGALHVRGEALGASPLPAVIASSTDAFAI
jgi:hypothetical protein